MKTAVYLASASISFRDNFLEDRPYFCDASHDLYKNRSRRDEIVAASSADVVWECTCTSGHV